jgi:hypothetical protein
MLLFENEITIESRPLLEEYLGSFEYRASGMSFTSLYMWRNINKFSWEIIGEYLCIAAVDNLEPEMDVPFMLPPLTRTGGYEAAGLAETICGARRIFEERGCAFKIMLVPFHMTDFLERAFPGKLRIEADRANFDYVYNTQDLIELKGRDYHAKKNHLNYFLSHYDYAYVSLRSDMAEEAMDFIRRFNERKNPENAHEKELLMMEERAMQDVFHNLERVGYLTGAIRINGAIEALSIGGRLGKKTVTVHVEKANTAFRGLYQAINNEFCKHVAKDVKRINREEDMGIPGLRKAKLSYKPSMLVEKYTVRFIDPTGCRRFR